MSINLNSEVKLLDIISWVRNKKDRALSYNLYTIVDENDLSLDAICYIGDPVKVTDDYEEIYPEFVISNSLNLLFRDELVQDAIDNAMVQKPSCANQDLLDAVIYYDEYDSFKVFRV